MYYLLVTCACTGPLCDKYCTLLPQGGGIFFRWRRHLCATMTKKKQVRKFGEVKRLLNPKDMRLCVVH